MKTIAFSIQKGGVSKTTTTGIVAALLAKEGYRVLVCDMDSQGNVSSLLTRQDIEAFYQKTILEAMKENDAEKYIHKTLVPGVDLLAADDLLITFTRWTYTEETRRRNPNTILKETLESVASNYDYCLIDTPPNLGELTQNAVVASDAVVILFEPSEFCYSAVGRYLDFLGSVERQAGKKVKVAGILRNLSDARRSDIRAYNIAIQNDYSELLFDTIITRKATTGRIPLYGLTSDKNKELADAIEPYIPFIKEFKERT